MEFEKELNTIILSINEGMATKKDWAERLNMKSAELTKRLKEAGYEWSMIDKRYEKVEIEINDESIEESEDEIKVEIKDESNKEIDDKINVEIKNEIKNEIKSEIKTKSKTEIKTKSNGVNDILNTFGKKKMKTVPLTTHLREDISKALNKFGADNGRGTKQELINMLLEMALKESGHLKI